MSGTVPRRKMRRETEGGRAGGAAEQQGTGRTVRLVVEVDSTAPIGGRVSVVDASSVSVPGVDLRFDGWLGLLHVLSELTADSASDPEEPT